MYGKERKSHETHIRNRIFRRCPGIASGVRHEQSGSMDADPDVADLRDGDSVSGGGCMEQDEKEATEKMQKRIGASERTAQRQLIRSAGLDPERWTIVHGNDRYLYLVDRGMEQRQKVIIDKTTGEVLKEKEMP